MGRRRRKQAFALKGKLGIEGGENGDGFRATSKVGVGRWERGRENWRDAPRSTVSGSLLQHQLCAASRTVQY